MAATGLATHYVIPRNKIVPSLTLRQVIQSGAYAKGKDGLALMEPVNLHLGDGPTGSGRVGWGQILPCKLGLVFVQDAHKRELMEVAEAFASVGIAQGIEIAFSGINMIMSAILHSQIEERLFSHENRAEQWLKGFEKHGARSIPYIDIVEITHSGQPKTFWKGDSQRLIVTCETQAGVQTTYRFPGFHKMWPEFFLKLRSEYEFEYLGQQAKSAQVDLDAVWNPIIEKYKAKFGDQFISHLSEMQAETVEPGNKQLEENGYTSQKWAADVLDLLGPLVATYRQIPHFSKYVEIFEQIKRGEV